MTTTDSNGLVQLTTEDPVTPLQTVLNAVTASISTAFDKTVRPFIVRTTGERNALAAERPPSATDPLIVWITGQSRFEINTGSGWSEWPPPFKWEPEDPELPGPNELWIGDKKYQATGLVTSIPQSPPFTQFGTVYARTFQFTGPFEPPAGWYFSLKCGQTTGHTFIENANTTTAKTISARHIQIGNKTVSALKSIIWTLKKR